MRLLRGAGHRGGGILAAHQGARAGQRGAGREAGCSPAQALLRWSLQKGFVTLPKSVKAERQAENLGALTGCELTPAQMAALDALEAGMTTGWDPVSQDAV